IYMNKVVARLIIHNMLSNAIKYAVIDTEIHFLIDQQENKLILICSNEATQKNIERIYRSEELFLAIEDNDAQNGAQEYIYSTGNGIYLIKELVNIVGGTFDISTEDEMISLCIEVPLRRE